MSNIDTLELINLIEYNKKLNEKGLKQIIDSNHFYHRFTISSDIYLCNFIDKLNDFKYEPHNYKIRAKERLKNKEKSARRKGVYVLYKDDKLIYIGMSINLLGRLRNHDIKFDFADVYLTRKHPFEIEAKAINTYRPPLNSMMYDYLD